MLLAACAFNTGPAYAVAGGEPAADGTYGFVAKLDIGFSGSDPRGCTGALIDPWWILTATSCFATGSGPVTAGLPPTPTTAVIGRTVTAAVVELVPAADRDVVLARLDRAATGITPVPVATTAAHDGETLRVAGYGRTADRWVPDRLHTALFTAQSSTATTVDITAADDDASICKGDAGGPALRETGGRVELVAINHLSWQRGCFDNAGETRDGAVESRVDDLTPWIGRTVSSCWTAAEAGFAPLHDGRSPQSGSWRTAGAGTVAEHACEVVPQGAGSIRWYGAEHLPTAYTLRLDWQATSATADSGVLIGFPHPGADPVAAAARGIEVEAKAGAGSGGLVGLAEPSAAAAKPAGQWNTFEIAVSGRRVTVRLNDVAVADHTVADASRLLGSAFVGLRGSAAGDTVRFRNVRLRVDQPAARFGLITGYGGRCADVIGYSTANGASLHLYECHGERNQMFTIPGDGTVRVMGRCLDTNGPAVGSSGDQEVKLWECNGLDYQQWQPRPDGTLYSPRTQRCLDWPTGATSSGKLYLYPCHGRANQQWTLPATPARFGFVVGDGGRCADVIGYSTENGASLHPYECHGEWNQMFTIPGDGTVRVMGKCLDTNGPAVGSSGDQEVKLWECNGLDYQQWQVRPDGTVFSPRTQRCLDVVPGAADPKLYLHACGSGATQRWTVPIRGSV
jgi:hypothetical protein